MSSLAGCRKAEPAHAETPHAEPSRTEFLLGTVCSVTLYDQAEDSIYRDIFSRIDEIENRMSINISGTDVDRINAAAGVSAVQVHDEVFAVVERALHYAEISGGAFDPTVGPLVALWDIAGENPRVPSHEEIDAVLPLISWRDVELDRDNRSVFLKRPGMRLDLGAIAKGYAADEAVEIIGNAGLRQAIVDLGGNVLTYGVKKDLSPWRIGLQNPGDGRGSYVGVVHGAAMTVVTSGDYERFFEEDGIRYHHIFSPFDGYPARSSLSAVTIITASSMDADALSTAVFVLGYEAGRALVESLDGVEAVFIFNDKSIRKTAGANFILSDEDFVLVGD
ncbi:MAG: FAD:protein FMN transferase [Treponema sp.]|nr:FAD:protein FMN transferase [Treponema sp.]